MLTPGQPAGLSREHAMALLEELKGAKRSLNQLDTGLRRLFEEV